MKQLFSLLLLLGLGLVSCSPAETDLPRFPPLSPAIGILERESLTISATPKDELSTEEFFRRVLELF